MNKELKKMYEESIERQMNELEGLVEEIKNDKISLDSYDWVGERLRQIIEKIGNHKKILEKEYCDSKFEMNLFTRAKNNIDKIKGKEK